MEENNELNAFDEDIENAEAVSDDEAEQESVKTFIFDWLEVLVHAIIVVVVCFSFIFRIATIDGPSMKDTLYHGERIIITDLFYTPKAGDIVVVSRNVENSIYTMNDQNTPIIKRIIATEGQKVDIKNGLVFVDDVQLDEPYARTSTQPKGEIVFPVVVPEGCVFVLGDNRAESMDSRDPRIGEYGMIDTRYILGHAVFRLFPLNRMGSLNE